MADRFGTDAETAYMNVVSGALLASVKVALRVSASAYDDEITDLIQAAMDDMKLSGVAAVHFTLDEPDPIIKRALVTYAKANFGLDNPDSEKFQRAYDSLKTHLCLSQEYQETPA